MTWLQTASGRAFHILNPRVEDVDIDDIAHALSHQCRFAGHSQSFYSVAQHSVLVSWLVPPEHKLAALLHDSAEAYLADVPTPLKQVMLQYREIEQRVLRVIGDRFGVELVDLPRCVHEADRIMLATEQRDVMRNPPPFEWRATRGVEPDPSSIYPWSAGMAKLRFLVRFEALSRAGVRGAAE